MTRAEYLDYRITFVEAARKVLAGGGSDVLSEAAFPAYANPNPLMNFLFWQRLHKVMVRLEQSAPYGNALDFGTGGGVMLPFLGRIARQAIGVDVDLSPFQKLSAQVRFPANVSVEDVNKKPLTSWSAGMFDVILALDVLEHVPDLGGTLAGLEKLLSRRGVLIVSGPTESLFYRIGRKLAGSEYSGHYHVRNIYDIKRALQPAFHVSTLATLYYPFPLFKLYVCQKHG